MSRVRVIAISLTQNIPPRHVNVIIDTTETWAKNNEVLISTPQEYFPASWFYTHVFPTQKRSRLLHEPLKSVNDTVSQDISKTPPFLNSFLFLLYAA